MTTLKISIPDHGQRTYDELKQAFELGDPSVNDQRIGGFSGIRKCRFKELNEKLDHLQLLKTVTEQVYEKLEVFHPRKYKFLSLETDKGRAISRIYAQIGDYKTQLRQLKQKYLEWVLTERGIEVDCPSLKKGK